MSCGLGLHVHPCSALEHGLCRHGFLVTRGCLPAHAVGPTGNEQWYATAPVCCDEDRAASLYPETGRPDSGSERT